MNPSDTLLTMTLERSIKPEDLSSTEQMETLQWIEENSDQIAFLLSHHLLLCTKKNKKAIDLQNMLPSVQKHTVFFPSIWEIKGLHKTQGTLYQTWSLMKKKNSTTTPCITINMGGGVTMKCEAISQTKIGLYISYMDNIQSSVIAKFAHGIYECACALSLSHKKKNVINPKITIVINSQLTNFHNTLINHLHAYQKLRANLIDESSASKSMPLLSIELAGGYPIPKHPPEATDKIIQNFIQGGPGLQTFFQPQAPARQSLNALKVSL